MCAAWELSHSAGQELAEFAAESLNKWISYYCKFSKKLNMLCLLKGFALLDSAELLNIAKSFAESTLNFLFMPAVLLEMTCLLANSTGTQRSLSL